MGCIVGKSKLEPCVPAGSVWSGGVRKSTLTVQFVPGICVEKSNQLCPIYTVADFYSIHRTAKIYFDIEQKDHAMVRHCCPPTSHQQSRGSSRLQKNK